MRSFTRQSGFLATLLLVALTTAAHLRLAVAPLAVEVADFPYLPVWWEVVVAVVAYSAAGMAVCRTAVKSGIFRTFCALPLPLFGIVACGIAVAPNAMNTALTTLCIALGTMMFTRDILDERTEAVLLGALFFGVAALLSPQTAIFILMLPAMFVICPLSPRLLAVAVASWLLPLFAVSYVRWYCGGGFTDVAVAMAERIATTHLTLSIGQTPPLGALIALAVAVLVLFSLGRRYALRTSMLMRTRKATQFAMLVLLFSLAMFALPSRSVAMLPTVAIPASMLAAYGLDGMPTKVANAIYRTLLLLAVAHLFVA